MIQIIDDQCDILAHIHIDIIRSGQQIWCLMYQIRRQNPVDGSILIVLLKFAQSFGE